jgi:hypothetical protein
LKDLILLSKHLPTSIVHISLFRLKQCRLLCKSNPISVDAEHWVAYHHEFWTAASSMSAATTPAADVVVVVVVVADDDPVAPVPADAASLRCFFFDVVAVDRALSSSEE